jgi:hypothetical protein
MISRRTTKIFSITSGKIGLGFEAGGYRYIDNTIIRIQQQLLGVQQAQRQIILAWCYSAILVK